MPKTNSIILATAFAELFKQVAAHQESLSSTSIPSPLVSPSQAAKPDDSAKNSFSLIELLSLCAGLLVGVPLVLVSLMYLVEYCQNKICSSNTNSVNPDPEASIETVVPKNNMIGNLDFDFQLNGNHTSQDGAHV